MQPTPEHTCGPRDTQVCHRHTRTHARTHARTHRHTHTHTHTHTGGGGGGGVFGLGTAPESPGLEVRITPLKVEKYVRKRYEVVVCRTQAESLRSTQAEGMSSTHVHTHVHVHTHTHTHRHTHTPYIFKHTHFQNNAYAQNSYLIHI